MQELVGGKNTIGRKAAVFKKPHKATFDLNSAFSADLKIFVLSYSDSYRSVFSVSELPYVRIYMCTHTYIYVGERKNSPNFEKIIKIFVQV